MKKIILVSMVMVFCLAGCGSSSHGTNTVKSESAEETKSTEKTESTEETEKATEQKESAEGVENTPTSGEPMAKGDGMASKENVLRLIKYCDYCYDNDIKLTYDDMVAVVGTEGKDGGNKGANVMSDYGDHMVTWYAGEDNAFVYFTFRRPDDKDEWTVRQWMSQNIDNAEVDAADISDLIQQ